MSNAHNPTRNASHDWGIFQLLSRHEQHLQRGLEAMGKDWLKSDEALQLPTLRHWVAARLHAPLHGDTSDVPAGALLLWKGWIHHDEGQIHAAHTLFQQAWSQFELHHSDKAEAALGLGKTHTRIGHWREARGWLLCALRMAREIGDDALSCKCYGALGEVLLRAGHSAAGYTCFNTAYHLLPSGSGQRPRQLNYLGTALRRLDEPLRAESVLMTSLHMARDLRDVASQWHALARLKFLHAGLDGQTGMTANLEAYVPQEVGPPVAQGYWQMAQARAAIRAARADAAALACAHLEEAMACFDRHRFPMEHLWAMRWSMHLNPTRGQCSLANAAAQDLMDVPALSSPRISGVIDETYARLPIGEGNGFAPLFAHKWSEASLLALDRHFFI